MDVDITLLKGKLLPVVSKALYFHILFYVSLRFNARSSSIEIDSTANIHAGSSNDANLQIALWSASTATCFSRVPGRFMVADFLSTIYSLYVSFACARPVVCHSSTHNAQLPIWLFFIKANYQIFFILVLKLFKSSSGFSRVLLERSYKVVIWLSASQLELYSPPPPRHWRSFRLDEVWRRRQEGM